MICNTNQKYHETVRDPGRFWDRPPWTTLGFSKVNNNLNIEGGEGKDGIRIIKNSIRV